MPQGLKAFSGKLGCLCDSAGRFSELLKFTDRSCDFAQRLQLFARSSAVPVVDDVSRVGPLTVPFTLTDTASAGQTVLTADYALSETSIRIDFSLTVEADQAAGNSQASLGGDIFFEVTEDIFYEISGQTW